MFAPDDDAHHLSDGRFVKGGLYEAPVLDASDYAPDLFVVVELRLVEKVAKAVNVWFVVGGPVLFLEHYDCGVNCPAFMRGQLQGHVNYLVVGQTGYVAAKPDSH